VLFATLTEQSKDCVSRLRVHWDKLAPAQKALVFYASLENLREVRVDWRLRWFVEFLRDNDSIKFSAPLLNNFMGRRSSEPLEVADLRAYVKEFESEAAAKVLELYSIEMAFPPSNVEDFGPMTRYSYLPESAAPEPLRNILGEVACAKLSGAFNFIRNALSFTCNPSSDTLETLLNCTSDKRTILASIPPCLCDIFPSRIGVKSLFDPKSGQALLDSPNTLITGQYLHQRRPYFRILPERNSTPEVNTREYCRLFDEHPDVALSFWSDRFEGFFGVLDEEYVANHVASRAFDNPVILRILHPQNWRRLLCGAGVKETELRRQLVEQAANVKMKFEIFALNLYHEDWQTIELRLPEEAALLIPLSNGIINTHSTGHSEIVLEGEESRMAVTFYSKIVTRFVPNSKCLEAVADNEKMSTELRIASLLLLMLHEDGGFGPVLARKKLLVDSAIMNIEVGSGFALCCDILKCERELVVSCALSQLLEVSKERLLSEGVLTEDRAIQVWSFVLSRWRARSIAPVTTFNKMEQWLLAPQQIDAT
jgi:hypothetical protein